MNTKEPWRYPSFPSVVNKINKAQWRSIGLQGTRSTTVWSNEKSARRSKDKSLKGITLKRSRVEPNGRGILQLARLSRSFIDSTLTTSTILDFFCKPNLVQQQAKGTKFI
jgi:hypothetical protein